MLCSCLNYIVITKGKLFKTSLIKFVMKIINLIITITIFLLGFLSASFLYGLVDSGYEVPLLKNLGLNSIGLINFSEKAPSDSINENQIEIYNDKIILNIGGASLSEYAPTGSMKPVFDQGANGIRIKVTSEDEIQVGDIISFRENGQLIVHRVVEKDTDTLGTYFITKGDNNSVSDGKIRIQDIEYKTIGVIW